MQQFVVSLLWCRVVDEIIQSWQFIYTEWQSRSTQNLLFIGNQTRNNRRHHAFPWTADSNQETRKKYFHPFLKWQFDFMAECIAFDVNIGFEDKCIDTVAPNSVIFVSCKEVSFRPQSIDRLFRYFFFTYSLSVRGTLHYLEPYIYLHSTYIAVHLAFTTNTRVSFVRDNWIAACAYSFLYCLRVLAH